MLTLTLQMPENEPQVFRFRQGSVVTIGRKPSNTLCISDSRISGQHGDIVWDGIVQSYRDLQSTNGSMILRDGKRIVVDGDSTPAVALFNGDLLLLGDVDNPVVLQVAIVNNSDELSVEGTVVAQRPMDGAHELSRLLLGGRGHNQSTDDLLRVLYALGGETEIEMAFGHVATYLLERLVRANSIVLALVDEAPLVLRRGESGVERVPEEPPVYPRGLVSAALEQGQALLASQILGGAPDKSLVRLDATCAVVVPLSHGNEHYGALIALSDNSGFTESELDVSAALAFQVQNCLDTTRLVRRLRAVERRLRDENRYLRSQAAPESSFSGIVGGSDAIRSVFEKIRVVMNTSATVLITGETGTGKELIARALHDQGSRSKSLFAAVNCAALSENLLESELFGHVKGAFTGAHDHKKGLFQVANGGTLFLDEIGELSLKLQAKLLRVLQEGEVMPVGSTRPQKVDVRILCATHRDLRAEVKANSFREDLFYRINVFPIEIPPLRKRGDDIGQLAEFFLSRYAKQFNKDTPGLTAGAIASLKRYEFPGNIRELENEMQRAVLLVPEGKPVDVGDLSDHVRAGDTVYGSEVSSDATIQSSGTLKDTMAAFERTVLLRTLEEHGWNRSAASRTLGISRQALMVKLSKYQLAPE